MGYRLERKAKRFASRLLAMLLHPRQITTSELLRMPVRQLLIIRQHNQMGDMVLSLPALRAIRRQWPQAHLRFVTAPICQELLRGHEDIDELLIFRKRQMRRPGALLRWIRQLRQPRPDVVIVLGTVSFSTTSALLAWCSAARIRIGASSQPFGSSLSRALYHLELTPPPEQGHELQRNLATLQALGIKPDPGFPVLQASAEAVATAGAFLRQGDEALAGRRLVVIHAGAGKLPNIWPAEYFAALIDHLVHVQQARVVLTEGPRDADIVSEVQKNTQVPTMRWQRSLGDTLGLLQHASLVVSNDTGMAHVAAAISRPTLVLFGPTDANQWCPVGEQVQVLLSPSKRIIDLPIEKVVAAAEDLLNPSETIG
jgi:heptosyltransferase-1